MFKNLFGGKKEKKKPAANIDETIAMLDKKIKDMELLINNLEVRQNAMQEEAKKKIKAGDKAGAKRILVKKKKIVEQIKQNEGALMMMEEQKGMLENSATTKGVIDAVKQATAVIKENKVDVEEFENVKEQMEEAKTDQEELNDFFKDYADQNEEGIEDDLKDLEAEIIKEETKNLPSAVKTQLDGEKVKTKNDVRKCNKYKRYDECNKSRNCRGQRCNKRY